MTCSCVECIGDQPDGPTDGEILSQATATIRALFERRPDMLVRFKAMMEAQRAEGVDVYAESAAVLAARDETVLDMMRLYSKACAEFAADPGEPTAARMESLRTQILAKQARRLGSINRAIDRLVDAARAAGSIPRTRLGQEAGDQADRTVEVFKVEVKALVGTLEG